MFKLATEYLLAHTSAFPPPFSWREERTEKKLFKLLCKDLLNVLRRLKGETPFPLHRVL